MEFTTEDTNVTPTPVTPQTPVPQPAAPSPAPQMQAAQPTTAQPVHTPIQTQATPATQAAAPIQPTQPIQTQPVAPTTATPQAAAPAPVATQPVSSPANRRFKRKHSLRLFPFSNRPRPLRQTQRPRLIPFPSKKNTRKKTANKKRKKRSLQS